MPTIQILLATAGGGGGIEPGQQEYTTPGTYTCLLYTSDAADE